MNAAEKPNFFQGSPFLLLLPGTLSRVEGVGNIIEWKSKPDSLQHEILHFSFDSSHPIQQPI